MVTLARTTSERTPQRFRCGGTRQKSVQSSKSVDHPSSAYLHRLRGENRFLFIDPRHAGPAAVRISAPMPQHRSLEFEQSADAFGIKIAGTGTTPDQILYSGEYLDPGTGNYDLRAREYNQNIGAFTTMDTTPGQLPYVYTSDNPVMFIDPSGDFFSLILSNFLYGRQVHEAIGSDFLEEYGTPPKAYSNASISTILHIKGTFWDKWRPDLVETASHEVYEIKSMNTGAVLGELQLQGYIAILNNFDPEHRSWHAGSDYIPPETIPIEDAPPGTFAIVSPPAAGVILYQVVSMSLAVAEVTGFAIADLMSSISTATLSAQLAF
jgi:RHS repeat-associated protein